MCSRDTSSRLKITLTVNGDRVTAYVAPGTNLLTFLREELGLVGTREGCGHGDCGSCTVLADGKPVLSCIMFAFQADGKAITTIEGISSGERLEIVQQCFVEKGAIQCGFCTPAMVLVAKSFLDEMPHPTRHQIREAISGVLCRCTGYKKIVDGVEEASLRKAGG
jgi:carbon-monoxide dehydrogenase small subunit